MKHLIFDLDGTLVDSRPGILYSIWVAIRQTLPEVDAENLQFEIGPPIRTMLQIGLQTQEEELLSTVEAKFRTTYDSVGWQKTIVYPDVTETLQTLKADGKCCYVATNKPALATSKITTHFGLSDYFLEILSLDSQQPPFPHKFAVLTYLIEKYRLSLNDCVYIGDAVEDRLAAEKCELPFIGIAYGYGNISQISGWYGVTSFSAIPSKIETLLTDRSPI